MGGLKNLLRTTLHFWPWEQNQIIMGGGFFIMEVLKNFSQPLWFIVLGTVPVYYGRKIFYYGRLLELIHNHFWIFVLGTAPV